MLDWIKTALKAIILIPVVAVVVLLSVANRGLVTVALDPFSPSDPAITAKVPLYGLIFGAVIVGVLLGGIGAWLAQSKHRRAERALRREADMLRADNERLKLAAIASAPRITNRAA